MNNDLNKVLKLAIVPARSPGYWEHFPKRVTALVGTDFRAVRIPITTWLVQQLSHTLWWATGLAAACLLVALFVCLRPQSESRTDFAKLYREISTMFPHQVRAIVSDENGVSVVLADKPDLPPASPLLVSICAAQQCRFVITFSGQQIPVDNGEADVLTDGRGNIIVAGPRFVWSSAEPSRGTGVYRITARRLGATS